MGGPQLWANLILAGKVAGGITSIGGLTLLIINWFRKVSETNRNVTLLLNNHIPHVQTALDTHGQTLIAIGSDVRSLGTEIQGVSRRLDDTRTGVHTLGESFLRHLEAASHEVSRIDSLEKKSKRNKKR